MMHLGIYLVLAAVTGMWLENQRPEKYDDPRYDYVSYMAGALWPITLGIAVAAHVESKMRKRKSND